MRKTMVALGALAGAAAASAQSSVTLFGVLDAAVSYYQTKSSFYSNTPPPASFIIPGDVKQSKRAMSTSNHTGSRLGFRGTEDLGGGLAAGFWLEAGINNDTGAGTALGGAFGFNRRSTMSLSGGFGEIRLGRDFVPTYWSDVIFDPFANGGVGNTLFGTIGANLAVARGPGSTVSASDNYTRSSNSVGYFLPPSLGGFYGQLMYALPENTKSSGEPQSPSQKGRYYGGRFGYASGALDVAVAYGESTAADSLFGTPSLSDKITTANLGASYDFGVAKLFVEISQLQDKRKSTNPLSPAPLAQLEINDKYTGGLIGVTVPVGAGLIRASYAKVNFNNGLNVVPVPFGLNDNDASTEKLSLGYVYNLSKRTLLYATAAKVQIKNGQNSPAIMGATTGGGLTYVSNGAGVRGYAPASSIGYDFGIKHSF
ncbi:porin [Variovorax sp. J22R133]|uniref:porin n=1 Tax=Variovorax brevis TaxID=3053503 RepID=UPI0025786243|nr:porin [Variovorax sp. J22R133]MDM0116246.1 porin [Variovorax sp. J22R133]